jgi:pyrimidine deaminase RibD-like protein
MMRLAISTAASSISEEGDPRPKVGAVLVTKDGNIFTAYRGEGEKGRHAEYVLLEDKASKIQAAGATLFTTLEPCTSRNEPKRPCADRIISRKIARVVVGMLDPNQMICGRGIRTLREASIQVDLFPHDLMAQVEEQNRDFTFFQEKQSKSQISGQAGQTASPLLNPHFESDNAKFDKLFKPQALINSNTVLVAVGDGFVGELLDRYSGALIRDEVEGFSNGDLFKRGILVGAYAWKQNAYLTESSPTISIGGANANEVSRQLTDEAKAREIKSFELGSGSGIYLPGKPPRVVLAGRFAEDTLSAVQHYIKRPRGLAEFLKNAWQV